MLCRTNEWHQDTPEEKSSEKISNYLRLSRAMQLTAAAWIDNLDCIVPVVCHRHWPRRVQSRRLRLLARGLSAEAAT